MAAPLARGAERGAKPSAASCGETVCLRLSEPPSPEPRACDPSPIQRTKYVGPVLSRPGGILTISQSPTPFSGIPTLLAFGIWHLALTPLIPRGGSPCRIAKLAVVVARSDIFAPTARSGRRAP